MSTLLQGYLTRSAERHPEKVAVVMGEQRLTYEELELESNRLASLLVESGCLRGDRICMLLPKSPTAIAAMIGVLKAGAAYVPMDVSSPAPRVESIIRACEPRLVLGCGDTLELANELLLGDSLSMGIGLLDDATGLTSSEPLFSRADWAKGSSEFREPGNTPEDLAHILFTSGSTGVPKGVMITHSNVSHFVEWATSHFGTTASDRISGHPPLHFDLSTFDIYGTLLAGAELHLVPPETNFQPETLVDFIRDGELTQWFSVPSALTFMIKYGAVSQGDFPHLKRLIWCGEVLPTPTLIEWMRRLPHVDFTNLYGPTEATIASSYFRVSDIPADPTTTIPIGEACDGEELVVLDGDMRSVAPGETGEIYIGGVGLSPGYWRDAEKTAAAFRVCDRGPKDNGIEGGRHNGIEGGRRLYRTGDLGYVGEDALIYILGRVDSQIKSRGYRIELGEIEAALNAQPVLKECAVVGVDVAGFVGTAICCAYSPLGDDGVSHVELRERVSRQLPSYMLPSRWLSLETLPKNLNGKIDRRKLKEHFESDVEMTVSTEDELGGGLEAPSEGTRPNLGDSDSTAERLRGMEGPLANRLSRAPRAEWDTIVLEEVQAAAAAILIYLPPESVEPDRAFKELGLDSLGAVELSSRLCEATGLPLASTLIFDHPTPAAVTGFLRSKLEGVKRGVATPMRSMTHTDEPIAIVGMSCRYPGDVRSPEDLWTLVVNERDAIGEFPADRGWDLDALYDPDPDHPGTSYSRHGGFVYDAGEFDAGFFSIAPREALAMDPQQRLLLEGAWEAFEDAGIDPLSLRGTPTGVFAGVVSVFTPDRRQFKGSDELAGFWLTGSGASVVSGRVSYTLGLEGPAVSVDTACSSSLVAMHLACQALRSGECSMALAGGVTVLSTPDVFIAFSRQRALSPDGRCRSFAAEADGTGWSEGVGLVLLERLSDAQRNGHRVLGLMRASATNQDGASNGLTAPNGPSQERVIRQALRSTGLSASEVDVVEAHGTGTTLGDPIEAQALLATYGQDRPGGRPLYLGSVKSNLGHTQAAAGVAGVIKMVMALQHETLPRTLHVNEPSPLVDWSGGEVELLREAIPWPAGEHPRRAGISSFGVSGTNAHVILEEAPSENVRPKGAPFLEGASPPVGAVPVPWLVSGRGASALCAQAESLRARVVTDQDLCIGDVGLSLAASRAALKDRAVVLGSDRKELIEGLDALARERQTAGVIQGAAGTGGERVAFLFTGQGSQRVGMGAELYEAFPVFARVFDEACLHLDAHLGRSLRGVVLEGGERCGSGSSHRSLLDDTAFTQAGLFALEVALFRLLEGLGVKPDFVAGHSIGELVAAYVAGVFSLEDACRLVAARGRLMGGLPEEGAMVAVGASEGEIVQTLVGFEDRVSVAAVNGPYSVVLSGDEQAVLELAQIWEERGRQTKRLRVWQAFHSSLMDGMLEEFGRVAEGVSFNEPSIALISNLTGEIAGEELCDPEYWVRHVRETVRFGDGVRWLADRGLRSFLELGPDGVLSGMVGECLGDGGLPGSDDSAGVIGAREDGKGAGEPTRVTAVPVLRAGRGETQALLAALAQVWVDGCDVDWARWFDGSGAERVRLPTYAFQRQRYWLDVLPEGTAGGQSSLGRALKGHPLLDAMVGLADGEGYLFVGRLSSQAPVWVADHVIMGSVLMPGTAFVELALHVGEELGCDVVDELVIESPLVLSEGDGGVRLQVSVEAPDETDRRLVRIYSCPEGAPDVDGVGGEGMWTRHASGVLASADAGSLESLGEERLRERVAALADKWPPEGAIGVAVDDFNSEMSAIGHDYGPMFLCVRAAWRRGDELFVEASLPDYEQPHATGYGIHPALFDAAIQGIGLSLNSGAADTAGDRDGLRLPFAFNGVQLHARGSSSLRVGLSPTGTDAMSMVALDESGMLVASMQSLSMRAISRERLARAHVGYRESLFRLEWTALAPAPSSHEVPTGEWACLSAETAPLCVSLRAHGVCFGFDDFDTLCEAIDNGRVVPHLVFVDCDMEDLEQGDDRSFAAGIVEGAHGSAQHALALVQRWLADERFSDARLVLMTKSAISVRPQDDVTGLAQAPVWGLVRSVQSEHPDRVVLVDWDGEHASIAALAAALAYDEPQLAVREGSVVAPRLARLHVSASHGVGVQGFGEIDPDGTILISGGTGGLGAVVAKHLIVVHGARHLLLVGRHGGAAPGADELEAELAGLGAQVTIAACDVADRQQLEALLDSVGEEHRLTAVLHVAGVLDDGVIESLTSEGLDRVLAPKVDGAFHLHELTSHLDLAAFVMFSSSAATLGAAGQANYAAANAFLDGLAAYRRARGLSGMSLAWGLWSEVGGMADQLGEADLTRIARSGLAALSVEEGLELLDGALAANEALVLPMHLDIPTLRAHVGDGPLPAVMRGLVSAPSMRASRTTGSLARRLVAVPERERGDVMLDVVRAEIATVLGHASAAAIGGQQPLSELGFDSLMAVELRNRLSSASGLRLPTTLVFDYPTPAALADYLIREISGTQLTAAASASAVSVVSSDDPIAIVGMSCRYPGGVSSPHELWKLLMAGNDALAPFPEDRGWDREALYNPDPDVPGTCYTCEGGFLDDPGGFDAAFFGISPREALAMDPHQRLLLEASWEALEDAGIDPTSLRGTQAGVFVGACSMDFAGGLWAAPRGRENLAGYWLTGSSGSVVSGRVSYVLGLEGPSVSVDTACSSSLVSLHLACQALRAGECPLAFSGGVTVMHTPGLFVQFSGQRGLAQDGRCKSFADAADGVGWGEGVGVVLLERLSDAERHGHRVLGLVRGSAVNQDGASNGLTAPNGPSQQRVIAQALARAGLSPAQVDAVEGHGTGTTLGDPIEANALLAAYGRERPSERPLWLGSIKSNIGHTVAAAGVAGVIKMVLAMRYNVLPRTLHVDRPSSKVDWSTGAVELLTEEQPWPQNGQPRRAGISSFAISGTNAHVIIEEPPPAASARQSDSVRPTSVPEVMPWILSAKDECALRAQAERLKAYVSADPGLSPVDVGFSLASTRTAFDQRAVLLGGNREAFLGELEALATGRSSASVVEGLVDESGGAIAFLFTGQGAQYVGMGAELYQTFPVFRDAFDEVCLYMDDHLERPLRGVVLGAGDGGRPAEDTVALDETSFTQAGLFALEIALFRLVESLGLLPDFVMGHSVGEIVAACVAGVFSLADACRLVAARCRLMGALPEGGAMVALQACEREGLEALAGLEDRVALAAVNGPSSVVLSGEEEAVMGVAESWEKRGRKTSRLRVSHAFHSQLVEPMLEEFGRVAGEMSFNDALIPVMSNVTGHVAEGRELCTAEYWVRHARETVRFGEGVRSLAEQGVGTFVELGPGGVLSGMVEDCLGECADEREREDVDGGATPRAESVGIGGGREGGGVAGERAAFMAIPTLRSGRPEMQTLLGGLARLWVGGVDVDWRILLEGAGGMRVELPTYAFQRDRFWLDSVGGRGGDVRAVGQVSADHPLLGAAVSLADGKGLVFTGRLSLQDHSWLADHRVLGSVLLPGTAFLELALRAGGQVGCGVVRELVLQTPLVLGENAARLQVVVGEPDGEGVRSLSVHSCAESAHVEEVFEDVVVEREETGWVCHAIGSLAPRGDARASGETSISPDGEWPPAGAEVISVDDVYEKLAESGLDYGPVFQGLHRAWGLDGELFVEVSLPHEELDRASSFGLHPALLDAVLHAMTLDEEPDSDPASDIPLLPFSWSEVELTCSAATTLRARLIPTENHNLSIYLTDQEGQAVASVGSLTMRPAPTTNTAESTHNNLNAMFGVEWVESQLPEPVSSDSAGLVTCAEGIAEALRRAGAACRVFSDLEALGEALHGGGLVARAMLFEVGWAEDNTAQAVGDDVGGASEEMGLDRVPDLVGAALHRGLASVQGWLSDERFSACRFVVLTRGAISVGGQEDVSDLAGGAVWGLIRSAQSENPGRFVLVDIDGEDASWEVLEQALALDEPQLAIRGGTVRVPRLGSLYGREVLASPQDGAAWRVDIERQGALEGLVLARCAEAEVVLEPGQVRIGVRAAGLNFRDVLIALGVYPGEASIGGEGAGVVVDVGPGVGELAVGDRVMGFMNGAMGTMAVADSRLVVRVPDGWSFTQGASVPIAFATAYYALVDLARLKLGERVLVHAAAGGVGMAAVQIARDLGAEVFATASPGKWEALRGLGLPDTHIASSRTLDFREEFLRGTGGAGMDVVLDCLAGEFVDASLDLLPNGGRFLELGKTDIRDSHELSGEHPDVVYRAFDVMDAGPQRLREMLVELAGLFERGVLECAPITTWNVRRAQQAFRHMSRAQHIGKNVLRMPGVIDSKGTVLITGGTGGLGALVARHLVIEHGVGHLLLVSRRGLEAAGGRELVDELSSLGAQVRVLACDVSEHEQLRGLLESIPAEHPLDAVVHAAGVIDDGVVDSLTPERIDRVLAPKVAGAWSLHQLTKNMDLSAFVLFSSVAATFGSPGQGNYAAANAFLDALAAHRHARGLAGTSMAWGLWAQASDMTSDLGELDLARMTRMGVLPLSNERGLQLLDGALSTNEPIVVPARLDTSGLRAQARIGELPAILSGIIRVRTRDTAHASGGSLARLLADSPQDQHHEIMLEFVRSQTAGVLGHQAPEAIDVRRPFKDFGFDSLAGIELRNRLNAQTGTRLPTTLIFDHPTPTAVARYLLAHVFANEDGAASSLDGELTALERRLSTTAPSGVTRTKIVARLQALIAGLDGGEAVVAVADDEDVRSATADEVFELIDMELGSLEQDGDTNVPG